MRGVPPQAVESGFAVGVEPADDADAVDAQILGDVLAGAAPVGRQDDLEAVAQLVILKRSSGRTASPGGNWMRIMAASYSGSTFTPPILESNSSSGTV